MRPFGLFLLLFAMALALPVASARPASAQEPPDVAINQVDAAGYPTINAVVTAIDSRSIPAAGLTAADFSAFEGAEPLAITGVAVAQDASVPLNVVMMIDVSGSMQGAPLDAAKAAATQFVASLAPDDRTALYSFAGEVIPVVPLTADRAALNAGIAGLTAAGPTALYEAVETAVFAANAAPGGRKAVVLLSDGVNDCPTCTATAESSITVARTAGVPVFAVGLGEPDDAYLQFLADETQGGYVRASTGELVDVYSRIAALLRNQYVVAIQGSGAADGADASLRIVAMIDGESVSSPPTSFTRGAPGAVATVAPTVVVPPPGSGDEGGGGGSNILLIVLAIFAVVALAVGAFLLYRRLRVRGKALAHQQATVAPNPRLSAAQTVPQPESAARVDPAQGIGRLSIIEGEGAGTSVQVSSLPLTIGADARSDVHVERSTDVASKHAQVWMRDGKMMLRHLAGSARETRVNGKAVDWVILDDGDAIAIGAIVLRAEVVSPGGSAAGQ